MATSVISRPPTATTADHELAAELARAAGDVLVATKSVGALEGRALGKAGDAVAQELLWRALAEARPDDAVLSEEAADDSDRLDASRVWIVDPLDGTREFGERRHDWAVHVALAVDGVPVAAAVALPGLRTVCATPHVTAAPRCGIDTGLRIAVSRSRPPAEAELLAKCLDAELVGLGSAGYKTMAVLSGEVDAYVHSGGQYEWDSAAPVGVALAAGLHASRIDGSPLRYNRADPLLPDLLVCRPELARPLLRELAGAALPTGAGA